MKMSAELLAKLAPGCATATPSVGHPQPWRDGKESEGSAPSATTVTLVALRETESQNHRIIWLDEANCTP